MITRHYPSLMSLGLIAAACSMPHTAAAQGGLPAVQEQGEVRYVSGGIGAPEAQAMRTQAARFPLAMMFFARVGSEGKYVSAVPVRIDDAKGNTVLITITQGPFLLVDLPAGNYLVSAAYKGETRKKPGACAQRSAHAAQFRLARRRSAGWARLSPVSVTQTDPDQFAPPAGAVGFGSDEARGAVMTNAIDAGKRAEFTIKLKRRYRELWADVQRELGEAQPYQTLAGETHDAEDEATADVLVDLNLADIHRDIVEMRDVEAALKRIVDHSYGCCSDCGDGIPLERLRAYPTAKRCRPCQQRYERTHVRTAGPKL